ncbi:MAG: hypothetical protein ACR2N8_03020 [Parvibaculales bacterium]
MSTQTQALSVGQNPDASRENMRKLFSIERRDNNFYNYFGDMDVTAPKEYIADYNLPSQVSDAEMTGIVDEDDVVSNTTAPQQIVNKTQLYATTASTLFNMGGNKVPGNLGDIGEQEKSLMLRCAKIIDVAGVSNYASRELAGSDGARAGSPSTFFGNGSETISENPGLLSVGSSSVTTVTNGGGYDATTKLSVAIDDDTVAGDRGSPQLINIADAVAQIHQSADANRASGQGRERDGEGSYVAFVPLSMYNRLFNTNLDGVTGQNRFTTMIGGAMTSIMGFVKKYDTGYGQVLILPVTDQKGGGSNNKNILVMRGSATEILYNNRPETDELKHKVITKDVAVTMSFTFKAPHSTSGCVLVASK